VSRSLLEGQLEPQMAGRLWWRVAGITAVLVAAAFAAWGTFGLRSASGGNGPLFIGSYGLDSGPGDGKQPMGLIIPITSTAHATIVIGGIRLIGGASYPAPRPFALRVIDYNQCAGVWPLRRTGRGLVLDGCAAHDLGTLIGHRVRWSGGGTVHQSEAVAEVWPPRSRSCWVLTHVAVRYHIGPEHFSARKPFADVRRSGACDPLSSLQSPS
jgi:hypothetical protein